MARAKLKPGEARVDKRTSTIRFVPPVRTLYKVHNEVAFTEGVLEITRTGKGRRLHVTASFYGYHEHFSVSDVRPKWVRARWNHNVFAIKIQRKAGWGSTLYFPLVDQPAKRPRKDP